MIVHHHVEQVAMAYSDLPYAEVMHKASIVNAAGADSASWVIGTR